MRVSSGTSWSSQAGLRTIEISLDSDDGVAMWPNKWPEWSFKEQLQQLQTRVDLLVLAYLKKEGGVSEDVFRSRISALRAELND